MSIVVENLSFAYKDFKVLNNLSFTIKDNAFTAVLGKNGAGKSTLFKCLLGLTNQWTGSVLINGQDVKKTPAIELAKQVAYIPQSQETSFNFSVFDMVLMGTTAHLKGYRIPCEKEKRITIEALERLEIGHLKNKGYRQISGGERQLVLIARAIAQQAKILILDEPIANLDYGNQIRVLNEIQNLIKEGYTVLQSMHSPNQVFFCADEILALKEGIIYKKGNPTDAITEQLIKDIYNIDVVIERQNSQNTPFCLPIKKF